MKRTLALNPPTLLAAGCLALTSVPALAANECKLQYGYHTGSGLNRQDHTSEVSMNAGEDKTYDRSNLNFVKNIGTNKVDVTLEGAFDNKFTLDKDKRNPTSGFYMTPVTLKKFSCTYGASAVSATTAEQLVAQLKQANTSVNQIAQQVKTQFNLTGQQVAALLKAAGYSASQVAGALASAFNATGAQVATWLKAAGYAGDQVAAALKSQFDATASQAAAWLKSAFDATGAQIAAWLKAAGYAGDQVAAALKSQFDATASQAAAWLKSAFDATGAQIANWLEAAGYTGEQVATALKAQFNATAAQAATWLKSVFNASAQQLALWLRNAGYSLIQVAQALDQLDVEPGQAMAALKQAFGTTWTEVVNAYKTLEVALGPTNCGAAGCNRGAEILKVAGAKAEEAIKALKDVYNLSESAARQIAQSVFDLSGPALDLAMAAAGYAAKSASTAVAGTMKLNYVLIGDSFKACNRYPSTRTYDPLPLPPTGSPLTVTLLGNDALGTASLVNDWPLGTLHKIRERGPCFLVIDVVVPSTARVGASGRAVVMAGNSPGPSFGWQVGPIPTPPRAPIVQQPSPPLVCPIGTRIDPNTNRCV
jgi:transcriptional regulator with XRE-family HTH domain